MNQHQDYEWERLCREAKQRWDEIQPEWELIQKKINSATRDGEHYQATSDDLKVADEESRLRQRYLQLLLQGPTLG